MKNKKELIERVNKMTDEDDFEFYILVSDKGCSVNGSKSEIKSMLCALLEDLKNKGALDNDDIEQICSAGKDGIKGVIKTTLSSIKDKSKADSMKEVLEDFLKKLEDM